MNLILVALLVSLLWGMSPVIHKSVLNKVSPRMLLIFNGIAISIIVLIYALLNKDDVLREGRELSAKTISWMLLAVFIGWFMAPLIFYTVLQKGQSHIIIAVAYSSPLFAMLFACLFLKERVTLWSFMGVLLIVSGISLLAYKNGDI